mmetsp:Transcript_33780/g.81287  ORF Transcript_33780/g.81287 Transcript_33780/m.81287 type:complete len:99 (-) Transcript_33780:9-305(-)
MNGIHVLSTTMGIERMRGCERNRTTIGRYSHRKLGLDTNHPAALGMDNDSGWLQQSTIDQQCDIGGGRDSIVSQCNVTYLSDLQKTNFKLQKLRGSRI